MLLIFLANKARSQVNDDMIAAADSLAKNLQKSTVKLRDDAEKKFLNHELATLTSTQKHSENIFKQLAFEKGTLPVGNTVALDFSDNSTKLQLSLSKFKRFESGKILIGTGGVNAKVSDNISQIFGGGKISNSTSFFMNLAVLNRGLQYKYVVGGHDRGNEVPTILGTLKNSLGNYINDFDFKYVHRLPQKIKSLVNRWHEIKGLLKDNLSNKTIKDLIIEMESIEKELEKEAIGLDWKNKLVEMTRQAENDIYNLEIDPAAWQWFKLKWLSGGIIYTRENIETYNNNLPFAKQFDNLPFDALEIIFAKHWFKQKSRDESGIFRTKYANISYKGRRVNSYSSLNPVDMEERTLKGIQNDSSIYIVQPRNVVDISKIGYRTGWQHNFGVTYSGMFNSSFGIKLIGSLSIGQFIKPLYGTRFGFLFNLNNRDYDNTENNKPKVNFEIFIQVTDMFGNNNLQKNIWKRKEIGINASIPFNKLFFN